MARSIERYLRLMPKANMLRTGGRMWCPPADVYRTRDGWIVKVELAGMSREEIEITITGATLHISGCRRDTTYAESISYQQLEITWSRFEKTIEFPCRIEGASMRRDYRDGLLILHLLGEESCE